MKKCGLALYPVASIILDSAMSRCYRTFFLSLNIHPTAETRKTRKGKWEDIECKKKLGGIITID